MKIITNTLNENGEGHIEFEFKGHIYTIGESDETDFSWFQRQTIDNYDNQTDGWELPIWYSETEFMNMDCEPLNITSPRRNWKKNPFRFLDKNVDN